ncbi:sulfate transporter CysZ [Methylobacillus sp.]|uniref:sulfate transporter CysZ n=1 Tax=Methylobacillus sp. TaxID=56818 RepID=UPI0012CC9009|nr:sulfate transporter CysZ [Methylobacillus sp.]MPS48667.1 sulfate transporter CysZ [Methylobacillus sp.]
MTTDIQLRGLSGPQYLLQGLKLVLSPGLRLFVLLPLLANLALFIGMVYYAVKQFDRWIAGLLSTLPGWLEFLSYLAWPLFVILLALIIFFTFSLFANLIAAPFNGLLAEKAEVMIRGQDDFPAFNLQELLAIVPRTLGRELRKLLYFLPRALGLMILSLIPGLNLLAPPLWLLFGVWMMCVQYLDYPADNHKLGWQDMLTWLRQKRLTSLGFGASVYAALWVPGLNVLMMPAAIAGATLFWVRERDPLPKASA